MNFNLINNYLYHIICIHNIKTLINIIFIENLKSKIILSIFLLKIYLKNQIYN